MTVETITTYDRVLAIIAKYLERDASDVQTVWTKGDLDSLELIEIGMALEEAFGIDNLNDEAVMACRSVDDFVKLVEGARKP